MTNDSPANVTFADLVKNLDIKLFENLALYSSLLQFSFLMKDQTVEDRTNYRR